MARVLEARHPELGIKVAIKIMHPQLAAEAHAAARFLREARVASRIRHPNVVQVFDVGTHEGIPFMVMEYVEGANLATLLQRHGALKHLPLIDLFLPVVSAVATAHEAGIIHRDLKPANLMLTQRPPRGVHPVVLDFGISKIASEEGEPALTRSESLLGTVQYMAPELTRGAKFATEASDQYALGVMLYECATGARPFSGESYYDVMHAIMTEAVAPVTTHSPWLPVGFAAVVSKSMSRNASDRYRSVHALGSALFGFASRTSQATWQREFTRSSTRIVDLWTSDGPTLIDEATGPLVAQRRPRPSYAIMGLAVAVASAVAVSSLIRKHADTSPAAPTHSPSIAAVPATAPVNEADSVGQSHPGDSSKSADLGPVLTPQFTKSTIVPSASANPARASTPKRMAAKHPAERALVPATVGPPPMVIGTNGSPIVE